MSELTQQAIVLMILGGGFAVSALGWYCELKARKEAQKLVSFYINRLIELRKEYEKDQDTPVHTGHTG